MTARAARGIAPAVLLLLMTGALVATTLVTPVWAGEPTTPSGQDDPRAVALLYRAMTAPDNVSYAGTQYVSAWSTMDRAASTSAVVDVEHTAGGPSVVTGHDARSVALPVEQGGGSWLAGSGGAVGLLVKSYDVRLAGQASVAGRLTEVVAAHRPDGSVAARLWLDAEHALPLRREVYDDAGRMVSASVFVDIEIRSGAIVPAFGNQRIGFGLDSGAPASTLSHRDLEDLRERGWLCPADLDGDMVLYEAHRLGDAVQLSYSDGIATISVFEQPGQLDPDTLPGFTARELGDGVVYAAPGPPTQFVWATGDDRVVTVVADGSIDSMDAVLQAYPPDEPHKPGLLERIGRGAKRLISWLDPRD